MRLLFTGRVVRASQRAIRSSHTPRPRNSTHVASSKVSPEEPPSPAAPFAIRRVPQGSNNLLHEIKELHSAEYRPDTVTNDSFHAFLRGAQEPNKVLTRDTASGVVISSNSYKLDSTSNISPSILNLLDRRLYDLPDHPISITRKLVQSASPPHLYQAYYATDPVVTTTANFGSSATMGGRPRDLILCWI